MIKWIVYNSHEDWFEDLAYFTDALAYKEVCKALYDRGHIIETFEEYLTKLEDITRYA